MSNLPATINRVRKLLSSSAFGSLCALVDCRLGAFALRGWRGRQKNAAALAAG